MDLEKLYNILHSFEHDAEPNEKFSNGTAACLFTATKHVPNPDEPTLDEALESPASEHWLNAMAEEIVSLLENKTFDLDTPFPTDGTKCLSCKWVFLKKRNADGSVRYKASIRRIGV